MQLLTRLAHPINEIRALMQGRIKSTDTIEQAIQRKRYNTFVSTNTLKQLKSITNNATCFPKGGSNELTEKTLDYIRFECESGFMGLNKIDSMLDGYREMASCIQGKGARAAVERLLRDRQLDIGYEIANREIELKEAKRNGDSIRIEIAEVWLNGCSRTTSTAGLHPGSDALPGDVSSATDANSVSDVDRGTGWSSAHLAVEAPKPGQIQRRHGPLTESGAALKQELMEEVQHVDLNIAPGDEILLSSPIVLPFAPLRDSVHPCSDPGSRRSSSATSDASAPEFEMLDNGLSHTRYSTGSEDARFDDEDACTGWMTSRRTLSARRPTSPEVQIKETSDYAVSPSSLSKDAVDRFVPEHFHVDTPRHTAGNGDQTDASRFIGREALMGAMR